MKLRNTFAALLVALTFAPLTLTACGAHDKTPDSGDVNPPSNPSTSEDPPAKNPEYEVRFDRETLLLAALEHADEGKAKAEVYKDGAADTSLAVTYTSGNPSVAEVADDGTVHAVGEGQTKITASYRTEKETLTDSLTVTVLGEAERTDVNSFDSACVNQYGRTYFYGNSPVLDNVCTGAEVAFVGTSLSMRFKNGAGQKIKAYVDGDTEGQATVLDSNLKVTVSGLDMGLHVVRFVKASSPQYGTVMVRGTGAFETDGVYLKAPAKSEFKIEVIGDSITAGAGANGTNAEPQQSVENSDSTKTYAYLAATQLNADLSVMALEGICVKDGTPDSYTAYAQYSTTNTAAYDHTMFDADIVVLALGENDMWHATSDQFPYTTDELRQDYADMLRAIRTAHPNAPIICAYGMMPASATARANSLFRAAISDTGDNNIYALKMLCNETGASYHPDANAHRTNAEKLVDLILEITEKQS